MAQEATDNFKKTGNMTFNHLAPVPEFITLRNSIIHAYQLVKEQGGSCKFPDINYELYYEMIDKEIDGISNPQLQADMRSVLSRQVRCPRELFRQRLLRISHFIFSWRSWSVKFTWILTAPRFQPLWNMAHHFFKVEMPAVHALSTEFDSSEDALVFASEHPRHHNSGLSYLETLLKAEWLKY